VRQDHAAQLTAAQLTAAVDITQVAAIAIAAGMRVDELAQIPLSFPTYTAILGRAAATAARQLNLSVTWQANQAEDAA